MSALQQVLYPETMGFRQSRAQRAESPDEGQLQRVGRENLVLVPHLLIALFGEWSCITKEKRKKEGMVGKAQIRITEKIKLNE